MNFGFPFPNFLGSSSIELKKIYNWRKTLTVIKHLFISSILRYIKSKKTSNQISIFFFGKTSLDLLLSVSSTLSEYKSKRQQGEKSQRYLFWTSCLTYVWQLVEGFWPLLQVLWCCYLFFPTLFHVNVRNPENKANLEDNPWIPVETAPFWGL